MVRFYIIFVLCLCFTYIIAKNMDENYSNQTNSASKSVYEIVQARIAAQRLARRFRNSTQFINKRTSTPKMEMIYSKTHNEILSNRIKILITISCLVLVSMIIIVIMCILRRYCQDKNPTTTERAPERKRPTQYYRVKTDNRNFNRKGRTLPTAV